jgi:hypothetical protein
VKRAHVDTVVHADRITEPDTGTALTVRAIARTSAGELADAWWQVGVGPGVGPHIGRDIKTLRRWAWALHQLADAIDDHTTAEPPPPDPSPAGRSVRVFVDGNEVKP